MKELHARASVVWRSHEKRGRQPEKRKERISFFAPLSSRAFSHGTFISYSKVYLFKLVSLFIDLHFRITQAVREVKNGPSKGEKTFSV